jgi:hypothetical protein
MDAMDAMDGMDETDGVGLAQAPYGFSPVAIAVSFCAFHS